MVDSAAPAPSELKQTTGTGPRNVDDSNEKPTIPAVVMINALKTVSRASVSALAPLTPSAPRSRPLRSP